MATQLEKAHHADIQNSFFHTNELHQTEDFQFPNTSNYIHFLLPYPNSLELIFDQFADHDTFHHLNCIERHLFLIEPLASPRVKGTGGQPDFASRRGSASDRDRVQPDVLSCPFQKCPPI